MCEEFETKQNHGVCSHRRNLAEYGIPVCDSKTLFCCWKYSSISILFFLCKKYLRTVYKKIGKIPGMKMFM